MVVLLGRRRGCSVHRERTLGGALVSNVWFSGDDESAVEVHCSRSKSKFLLGMEVVVEDLDGKDRSSLTTCSRAARQE